MKLKVHNTPEKTVRTINITIGVNSYRLSDVRGKLSIIKIGELIDDIRVYPQNKNEIEIK